MPLLQTSGNDTADAYGGGAAAVPNYIEDVFSTYLYTGDGSVQTVVNGVDLAGKGGMVWTKDRSAARNNILINTTQGGSKYLASNQTNGTRNAEYITAFNSNGYTYDGGFGDMGAPGENYVSWTFRKQPKFFDVVTWTGNNVNFRAIQHNLGSAPGCIIIKRTDTTGPWMVTTRKTVPDISGDWFVGRLNTTQGENDNARLSGGYASWYGSYAPTATQFQVQSDSDMYNVNASGASYVAYLFAHDAGGFGLTGTDNVISCGSYVGDATVQPITLGYEPQWLLIKRIDTTGGWILNDNMRGFSTGPGDGANAWMQPQSSNAEYVTQPYVSPTATGFNFPFSGGLNVSGGTYIYIAIRRGPMKVPTDATKVFSPVAFTGNTSSYTGTNTNTVGFAGDVYLNKARTLAGQNFLFVDKLRGSQVCLYTSLTNAEENFGSTQSSSEYIRFNNTQVELGGYATNQSLYNYSSTPTIGYTFQRAPSFFDEVCYTGTGSFPQSVSHNLNAVPELMIIKSRSSVADWYVYSSALTVSQALYLNSTNARDSANFWDSRPTTTQFTVNVNGVGGAGNTYVAYLFATCAGVSKVGSYTGTGATQTISCGFTGGARFVLIKRTDLSGSWYVWDTARGMVSGTDPSLLLNSTAAEVNANSIYTTTGGFQIVSTAAGINASGGNYIYLAIA